MTSFEHIVQFGTALGFCLLAAICVARWIRIRDRLRGYLALAVSLLAVVALLGEVGTLTDHRYSFLAYPSLVAFLGSGYFLLLIRHELIPLARWTHAAMLAAVVVSGVAALIVDLPYEQDPEYTGAQSVAVLAVVAVWIACVCEPIVRFWLASGSLPAVQRARLRALSYGYGGIVAILVVAIAARPAPRSGAAIAIEVTTMALLPLLYAAFAPPQWLRRGWRRSEEEDLRLARGLVSYADSPSVLGELALHWAARLVGGRGGFLFDGDGNLLAREDIEEADVYPLARALSSGEARDVPLYIGDQRWAVGVAVPCSVGEGLLAVIGGALTPLFGSDEAERLEEHARSIGVALDRVRVVADLHRLDTARREFIANAAHELRTPLTTIVGLSSSLVAARERAEPQRLFAGLEAVDRQAQRMTSLVNNLLDLTQVEQGKLKVDLQPLEVASVVEQAVEAAPPTNGTSVAVDVDRGLRVVADPMRLDQVITNLLSNAYRYGGTDVRVEGCAREEEVLLIVSDDGPGVPPELVPRVFEPFTRAQNGSDARGSGLGLAIVRKLVEAFGGSVGYETGQPTGARFVVRLRRHA